jgi:hypothetical protein
MDGNFTIALPGTDDAEWVDHRGLKRRFSIGRSAAYTHIENDDFLSVVLRRKGRIRGRRLFFVPSVREYFAKQSGGIDSRLTEACKAANRAMQESQKVKREKEAAEKARKLKTEKETKI